MENPPYYAKIKGRSPQGWLRKSFVKKMIEANTYLKPYDVEVFIFDAYKAIKCQHGLWDYFYARGGKEIGTDEDKLCTKYALKYVRDSRTYDLKNPRGFHIHSSGGAIGASLRKISTGELLNMGHTLNKLMICVPDYFERLLLKGDERLHNRRWMGGGAKAGLQNHPIAKYRF